MQIIKGTGINWHKRRLISKLYMGPRVRIRLDQGAIRSVKSGRGVRTGRCLSMILFNSYSKYLTKEALQGFGDIKIGHTVCTVKNADDIVLMGMTDRLTETGRCYGMEINVDKTKVMSISKATISNIHYDSSKTMGECGTFQLFG
jgi:hypothetical protein